jgi:tripartite-type tricarboxylate transporter receptor subunit TctC
MSKTMMKELAKCSAVLIGTVTALIASSATAQTFPSRPLRFLVPFAPGGATDITSRVIAPRLGDRLGQQVVVDNRPGAGSIVGTQILARSTPDGHTVMLAEIAFGANPALHSKLPYDTRKDFAPVILVALMPTILVVPPTLPAKSVTELIALAKTKPGGLNYSSSGIGSANFLAAELFKSKTGTDVVHIPFQGGGQAIAGVISGQAQMLFTTMPPSLPQVRAGKLRAIAIAHSQRSPLLPDVPTTAEAGLPGFEVALWVGVLAPAGTPATVITRLNSDIQHVLDIADVRSRIGNLGADIVGGAPQVLAKYIDAELKRWAATIKPEMRVN